MFRAMLMLALSMAAGAVQPAEEFTVEGTVNAIQLKEQKITLESIRGLAGETTHDFAVQDPGMLEEVQIGSTLKFNIIRELGGALVITDFEPVAAAPSKSPLKK